MVGIKAQAPAEPQQNPYLPQGVDVRRMEVFGGINTSRTRSGIPDEQCAWIDGFIPVDAHNLRTLYDAGGSIYTAGGGATITCFFSGNLGTTPILVIFRSDGMVHQLNLLTNEIKQILPINTILNPDSLHVDVAQWAQQYIIIVSDQVNGYWLWDGTNLYGAGTLSPQVTITNPGSSYQTVPAVVVSGGTGTGVVAQAQIGGGFVTGITIVNPGSGYSVGDILTVNILGGATGGSGASLTAVLTHQLGGSGGSLQLNFVSIGGRYFVLGNVTILNGGSGYSFNTVATISGGNVINNDNATISIGVVGGVITSVTVTHQGSYLTLSPSPTVTITDTGFFTVTSVTVNSGGSGYSQSTTVTASGGGSPQVQATFKPVIASGVITSVLVQTGGVYGSNTPPALTVNDTPVTAQATVLLMPFGVQGAVVEVFSNRVWVFRQNKYQFTAPSSFSDFATSDGGGTQTSGDSTLRAAYIRAVNTNGFLFTVGDSSLSYISGVQTSGSPPTTTYTNQNADPQVGTSYPAAVITFGRDILMANGEGIYRSQGGAMAKISDELDGVYKTVANFNGLQLSAAVATLASQAGPSYSKKVAIFLIPIVDPVSGQTVNKLLMWDGQRWFAAQQHVALTFIGSSEINSVITPFGTDGLAIYTLLGTPTNTMQKAVRSKFWGEPMFLRSAGAFFAQIDYYNANTNSLSVAIDSEVASTSYPITTPNTVGSFTPAQAVASTGTLTGMTIQTTAQDAALVMAMMTDSNVGYRGN